MKLRLQFVPVMLAALACAPAFAAAPATASAKAPTAQQSRMATCSAQNKGKKGADYKAAQSACLKGQASAPVTAKTSQQRMAACSAQNKGKKGAEYKAAQSACLKKS
jgi:hypothetical protein